MSLTQFLVIFGLILTAIGGWLDITSQTHGCGCGVRFLGLSKHHYWNDGIVLLLLAILIKSL